MKKKIAISISLLAALALAMAPFPQGLKVIGGILFQERADHSQTPAAGFGEFWVRSDGKPMFTDEAGTDIDLSAGGGGGGSGTVTSVGITPTDGLQVDSGSPVTTSGSIQLGVDAAAMRAHLNVADGATAGGDPTYGSAGGASDGAVYVDADNQLGLGTTTPSSSIHLYSESAAPGIGYQFYSEAAADVTAYGGTATSVTSSDEGWVNTSNTAANDGANATVGLLTFPSYTEDLKITNFSFAIPTGATVDGIEVDVEGYSNSGSRAEDVYLVRGGTKDTTVDRATGTAWTASPAVYTYGGPADVWGGFTPAEINNSGFGVVWRGYMGSVGIAIDYITITIYYTESDGDFHWVTGISLPGGDWTINEGATDHVSIAPGTGDTTFLGDVTAAAFIGDGSGLTGLPGGVSGPVSSTDNAIPRFSGTGGDTLENTTVAIDDNGNITLASGDTVDGRDVSADGTKLDGIATGATANTGTVTSVAASGTDGLEVDSGSPVTTSGTITLGVNASTLYAHLVSTASTVTGASGDTLLISDSSAAGALAEIAITDLIFAGSSTDNRIPKRNGTAGQLEDSGISIDDSDNVSGMGTLNSHAIPSGSGAFVTTDAVQTLTNKDVAGRELTDSSTPVDVNATDYDQVVTVLAANTTFNAPTSPPRNGKRLLYMVKQAASGGPYTGTWNSVFRSPDSWGIASNAIPAVSATAGTWDYYLFIWNDDIDKWDLLATSAPLS